VIKSPHYLPDKRYHKAMTVQSTIENKLNEAFAPTHLDVVNESNNHNVPAGSESHFKVTVVSAEFDGKRLLQRHRAINKTLSDELANDIHALAMHTYTQAEWVEHNQTSPDSPNCMGGSK
jgi:BolA protein